MTFMFHRITTENCLFWHRREFEFWEYSRLWEQVPTYVSVVQKLYWGSMAHNLLRNDFSVKWRSGTNKWDWVFSFWYMTLTAEYYQQCCYLIYLLPLMQSGSQTNWESASVFPLLPTHFLRMTLQFFFQALNCECLFQQMISAVACVIGPEICARTAAGSIAWSLEQL